ncbi:peptide ABC transporter ATP-binding protein [Lactococcus hodotermopsidis]|uniref:Peptide ABC transporter ATP-binding protein n=1 Tax=Pseudolactococcus hodotermopsidis TaxID=2709157 RepID=A0A6A0BDC0_9LACT|nr:ATP-binding cassette domain-containing protein [Lactococcus hodotermopsidis]GFH43429.1 peptide ABC transporter ATP-binding protein [Lactococcus hodotermopsidis]
MIELKDISKSYDGYKVLSHFDYQFEAGKSYALTGKSGSGKTTLLNMIGRLETPDTGEVLLDGKDLSKLSERVYFRDYLGYLFQNYGLIDNESIRDNLALAFVGKKESRDKQETLMAQALKQVNLENHDLKRKIFSLSGGEAQRVAIAKLMLKQPSIILADEPTGALDEDTGREIIDILISLIGDETTLIIATHDLHVYSRVDDVLHLS